MEGGETKKLLQLLTEMEAAAEDILTDKQQLIDLDRKRQKTREALRVLAKDKKSKSQWICIGNMFFKLPHDATKQTLDKDFDQIGSEIRTLEKGLKPKVNKLRDLEKEDDIKGFHLNPLSKVDMKIVDAYYFDQIGSEIRTLEKGLKPKVNKLRDLEKEDDIKGFHLNPLSKEDMKIVDAYCD